METLAVRGVAAGVAAVLAFAVSLAFIPLPFNFLWLAGAAEALFAVHYAVLAWRIDAMIHASLPDDYDPSTTKRKLLHHLKRVDDIQGCMKSWFVNAQHWDDIKRRNLKELFAYAVWYKTIDQMRADGLEEELEDLVCQLERQVGCRVPEGYNSQVRFMSHLWDPLRHVYRPLVFYVVMELLAWLCHVVLLAAGFRLWQLGGISYYTLHLGPQQVVQAIGKHLASKQHKCQRTAAAAADGAAGAAADLHRDTAEAGSACTAAAAVSPAAGDAEGQRQRQPGKADALPLVFLHGVGAGLLPYLSLIFHLASLGQPMILPESKHVSMRLVSWLPTVDDMADGTAAIMAAHGVDQAVVMAHSYGTMVAARLVMKYEGMVHSLCLMDPVCFAMYMPHLIRNFLYTWHRSGCLAIDVIMALVSSELHCTRTFSRRFFWTSINLWDEHIPPRTLVVLSGRDILSPTDDVHKWLREHTPAQVLYKPGMAHAGILVNTAWQATVVQAFLQVINGPQGSKAAAAAAVAAAEAPCGSAADVAVAAAAAAEQQGACGSCSGSGGIGGTGSGSTAQEQEQEGSSGAGCGDADSSSVDTDDTAWESMHTPQGVISCSSCPAAGGVRGSHACSCCNCLNCQLFPAASPSSSGSDDMIPDAVRGCIDDAAAAVSTCEGVRSSAAAAAAAAARMGAAGDAAPDGAKWHQQQQPVLQQKAVASTAAGGGPKLVMSCTQEAAEAGGHSGQWQVQRTLSHSQGSYLSDLEDV